MQAVSRVTPYNKKPAVPASLSTTVVDLLLINPYAVRPLGAVLLSEIMTTLTTTITATAKITPTTATREIRPNRTTVHTAQAIRTKVANMAFEEELQSELQYGRHDLVIIEAIVLLLFERLC